MSASFEKIASLFQEALEVSSFERDEFLDRACAGEAGLLVEVQSLLRRHDQKTGAFEEAVRPVAKDLLATISTGSEFARGAMLGPYRRYSTGTPAVSAGCVRHLRSIKQHRYKSPTHR